jgi:hypothetical protein
LIRETLRLFRIPTSGPEEEATGCTTDAGGTMISFSGSTVVAGVFLIASAEA